MLNVIYVHCATCIKDNNHTPCAALHVLIYRWRRYTKSIVTFGHFKWNLSGNFLAALWHWAAVRQENNIISWPTLCQNFRINVSFWHSAFPMTLCLCCVTFNVRGKAPEQHYCGTLLLSPRVYPLHLLIGCCDSQERRFNIWWACGRPVGTRRKTWATWLAMRWA